jgi:hypothetical protein
VRIVVRGDGISSVTEIDDALLANPLFVKFAIIVKPFGLPVRQQELAKGDDQ